VRKGESELYFGVDYYPEHWPRERWAEDARLMAEAGMNVVRLAEFAWSKMEPEEGKYQFEWLEEVIDILGRRGINTILGTPTASPPAWLISQNPDILPVDEEHQRIEFGNRRNYCVTNSTYRKYTQKIVTAMAERFKNNPRVIGWQIDNEFGTRCYCDFCQQQFQSWLKEKYQDIDNLNQRWGTVFWSHTYCDWKEIPLPWKTGGSPNPGLALDYRRFMSQVFVDYQELQIKILRKICPHHFITHNFMGAGYDQLNYYDLARSLDFVSWDNYPRYHSQAEIDYFLIKLSHDLMRGLKRKNFWVMESQSGSSGWEIVGSIPRPDEIRFWTYQAIAHGGEGVLYFRWRTCRFGTEQYWHGILGHDGIPRRRYLEVKRTGQELAALSAKISGARYLADTAMLLSYDDRFAFEIQPHNSQFNYLTQFGNYYAALSYLGVGVDVISPLEDLSHYQLVIAPTLHIVTPQIVRNLDQYVQNGGTLILTARGGVKDEFNTVVDKPLPGLLTDLVGAEIKEYDSLPPGKTVELEMVHQELAGLKDKAHIWCDFLEPQEAVPLARYCEEYYRGEVAATLHKYGQGQVVYIGTFLNSNIIFYLLRWLSNKLGIKAPINTPIGIEVTRRQKDNQYYIFLLNETGETKVLFLEKKFRHLLTGKIVEGIINLSPLEVVILEAS